jgi:uncharacterized protein (TIGR03435 family)
MFRCAAVGFIVFSSYGVFGQTPPPEFDAVSIKPNKSGDVRGGTHPSPGGRFTATNVTTKTLIEWAYQIRDFQLSGEPGWVDTEKFDVAAKADGNPRYDFLQPTLETMFQTVLADRFKLAVHRVTKELPVYSLVVAKSGPTIRPVDEGNRPEVPTAQNPCRFLRPMQFGQLTAEKAPLSALAFMLITFTGRTVLDKTDLKGSYSYTLDWTKYLQPEPSTAGADRSVPIVFDPASIEPAIASALEEELGLKLEAGKGPVEMIAVDHVERPSEN